MPLRRITFITNIFPSAENPSTGTFVKNSYEGLRSLGRDVDVISLQRNPPTLISYARFYYVGIRSLRRSDGIAYVHYVSHSALPAVLAKVVNRRLTVALHFHGGDAFPDVVETRIRRAAKRLMCRVAIRSADIIVAPSEAYADRLCGAFRIPRDKLSVSPSAGVDRSVFQNAVRPEPQNKRVLFAGRMIASKGASVAASALKRAFDEPGPAFDVTLIGSGPDRRKAEAILQHEVRDGRVTFIDAVDQQRLAGHLKQADILLFPSTGEESLGLILIEAIFCGAVPLSFDSPTSRAVLGGIRRPRLLAKDREEFLFIMRALLELPAAELRDINDRLKADNDHFESEAVALALNRILS